MKKLTIFLVLLTISLACGMTAPAQLPKNVNTAEPYEQLTAETVIQPTATRSPVMLDVLGCWNVREGAGTSYPVREVLCGGSVKLVSRASNGFVEVITDRGKGFVCARAFGVAAECE